MKTYKQRTDSILNKVEKIKQKRRKTVWISVVSSLCAVLVLANVTLLLPQTLTKFGAANGGNMMEAVPDSSTHVTSENHWATEEIDPSYERLVAQIKSVLYDQPNSDEQVESSDYAEAPGAPEDGDMSMENTSQKPTLNQEQAIVEGDIFERTDTHIFYVKKAKNIRQSHQILVYSVEGADSKKVGSHFVKRDVYLGEEYSFIGAPRLYLSEDNNTLIMVAPCEVSGEYTQYYTAIISLDVSNPTAIFEKNRTYLSGSYNASCAENGTLFISSRFSVAQEPDFSEESSFLPQYGGLRNKQSVQASDILYPETTPKYAVYTTLCVIDIETLKEQGFVAMFSMYTSMAVVKENVIFYELTSGCWEEETSKQTLTRIHCFLYKNRLEYKGYVDVLGSLNNATDVKESFGILYVTTKNKNHPKTENQYKIRLLDLEITMKQEWLERSQTAGLLEFYNGTWLKIGGDWRYGLELEVFSQTETGLESVAIYELECGFSKDSKTYFIDEERGLFGLSVTMWTGDNGIQDSYLLLHFDGSVWKKLQVKTPCDGIDDTRAVLIEEYLYIFSGETFYVISV